MFAEILEKIIENRQSANACGITSFCIANPLAIKAVLTHGKNAGLPLLFEATSNQVNQFGGYTGMTPQAYKQMIYSLAREVDYPPENLMFGGDHLGPLPFSDRVAEEAMKLAEEMINSYVSAGYEKIHIDTSMYLGSDDNGKSLSKDLIAERGAILLKSALRTFGEYKKQFPNARIPKFVIGSEVPPAGGQDAGAKTVEVSSPEDLEQSVAAYDRAFKKFGIDNPWSHIVAMVVQPGVEYGNNAVVHYDSDDARHLMGKLAELKGIVFEGHSTDYQTPEALKAMVRDGVGILKVGPAITMSMREAIINLEKIEDLLVPKTAEKSNFSKILQDVMSQNPKHWEKYYKGSEKDIKIAKEYSLLNRSRYYYSLPEVQKSMDILFSNVNWLRISGGVIRQFFPMQFRRLKWEKASAIDLINDYISVQIEDYDYATGAKGLML